MIIHRPPLFHQRPACVLVDLDNTLYDYPRCNAAGMSAAANLAKAHLNLPLGPFLHAVAQARADLKARLGSQAASHNRLLYFQGLVERAGFASQPYLALQLDQAYWRAYLDAARLFEDARSFLDDLRIAGVPIVMVTDQLAHIQMRKLIVLGLDRIIDGLVTSEETGQDKPAATNFRLALAKVEKWDGAQAGGPVWMIGDDPLRDMAGGKQAIGAVTLHKTVTRRGMADSEAIDASFHRFADLRTLFASLDSAKDVGGKIRAIR